MMKTIKQECPSCKGVGLYRGFYDAPGEAVICGGCAGKGWSLYQYQEFTGRKKKRDIKTIRGSRGTFIATGVGGVRPRMTYKEFEQQYPEE
jgi:hypothetical protein